MDEDTGRVAIEDLRAIVNKHIPGTFVLDREWLFDALDELEWFRLYVAPKDDEPIPYTLTDKETD